MDILEFKISAFSWGVHRKECYSINLKTKACAHTENNRHIRNRVLSKEEFERVLDFVNRFVKEPILDSFGFDAPIFEMLLDGKAIARGIAVNDANKTYSMINDFFKSLI